MRRIEHDEPTPPYLARMAESHTEAVFNPREAWGNFAGKQEIKDRLWPLQKGLCAYCESNLKTSGCHIEHIRRKSRHHEETFRWANLVLNCDQTDSCGHFKDRNKKGAPAVSDDPLFVKPTDPDCGVYFLYNLVDGRIYPSPRLTGENDWNKAQFTIDALGLNSFRLMRHRGDILKKFRDIFYSLSNSEEARTLYLAAEFPEVGDDLAFWSARRQEYERCIREMAADS